MKANKVIWGIVSLSVLFTIAGASGSLPSLGREGALQKPNGSPTQVTSETRDLSKYGSVEYATTEGMTTDTERFLTNRRYDNQKWVFKSVSNNPQAAGVGKITDDPPPPLYPVEESSMIVVGEVTSAKVFLSNDKGGVYTEFTIQVDEVLKNNSKNSKDKITADREGGVVIYPNGQRILYQSSMLMLPLVGSKYLFFLVKRGEGSNYEIRTSYDINGSSVYPLEIGNAFEDFKNTTTPHLINVVRKKIAKNH